jgi:aldehyde reductase
MKTHVEFFNGQKMPIVGLGLWQATNPGELETAVDEALKAGYRHFDTAYNYENEDVFGKILKKWLDSGKVKREELFITTKLPLIAMQPNRVEEFLNKSLTALQLSYVDLYLVHCPIGLQYVSDTDLFPRKDGQLLLDNTTDLVGIWKAMEKQVDAGRAKAIGISNYNSEQIERTLKNARIQPANLQVECNVFFPQKPLREFCKKHNITVVAYAPFGSPGRKALYEKRGVTNVEFPAILQDPVVAKVAEKHNRTPAQVLLRFLAQQDVVVIPKSVSAERIQKNIQIFDFELDANDMALLDGLDKGPAGRSFDFQRTFPGIDAHPENPYLIPY